MVFVNRYVALSCLWISTWHCDVYAALSTLGIRFGLVQPWLISAKLHTIIEGDVRCLFCLGGCLERERREGGRERGGREGGRGERGGGREGERGGGREGS